MSPPVAVELEAAFEALDAALHLGQVVRLAAARTGRVVGVAIGCRGGSGRRGGSLSGRRRAGHRPNTIRSLLRSATVARRNPAAATTATPAAATKASGPGA